MTEQKDTLLASELRTVVTRLIKKLRKQSSSADKLSLTERSIIALLDKHQELLPNELATMEKITTQSMSQILSKLQQMNLIKRRISETDKRKVIISLSDSGRDLLYQVRNERNEWLNKALDATCTAEEKELLKLAIAPLTKLVDFD
ncbi:MarR family winged helix-turn-helix transcriptional regulator [Mucilaginibacter lappiensis]|uniref:DNA-binding MarR family transcriptional regulator n=1 Tax=Mucilaginibacter lappiensis TaxID=354630 RepID=A0A1N6VLM5_9SPHI|nr:MarR family transcriptional regulator [Mucilaginibacter lappiensis]MBB6109174.1 DNA-binding MarR family transcriptional regulator [Mucilaginibacter lappiensis]MBB6127232.1 DNA-binding MarR family transcriptional regulator [Mucilaginibacter lappiensis]SIQ78638.1 DNA-binding transcriptional regulator, MarR family [Mucilaginibacter lappiensis]